MSLCDKTQAPVQQFNTDTETFQGTDCFFPPTIWKLLFTPSKPVVWTCNSSPSVITKTLLSHLHLIQKLSSQDFVISSRKHDRITPLLATSAHWLLVALSIDFKILSITCPKLFNRSMLPFVPSSSLGNRQALFLIDLRSGASAVQPQGLWNKLFRSSEPHLLNESQKLQKTSFVFLIACGAFGCI